MKILLTVDPEIPVPPLNYGGIERIVDSLIYEYKKHGHTVYLVANPKSENSGLEKLFSWPRLKSRGYYNTFKNAMFLKNVVSNIQPDVIHSFSRLLYLYPLKLIKTPNILQTYQRGINIRSTSLATRIFGKKIHFTCCGKHMIENHPIASKCTPVYNFTDTNYFRPDNNIQREYLFFLGRIEDIKGAKEAIQAAIASNQPLVIAGNIQPGHNEYFETQVRPHLSNDLIKYVGPVNDEQKLGYFQKAKAFLFPIKWEEPFGIVMAEALSCGVPVIGFRRGSVPEVVQDKKTGFVVEDVAAMVEAIGNLNQINNDEVREDCERRFALQTICLEYLQIFENEF